MYHKLALPYTSHIAIVAYTSIIFVCSYNNGDAS